MSSTAQRSTRTRTEEGPLELAIKELSGDLAESSFRAQCSCLHRAVLEVVRGGSDLLIKNHLFLALGYASSLNK